MSENSPLNALAKYFDGSIDKEALDGFKSLQQEIIRQRDENLEQQKRLEHERAEIQEYLSRREEEILEREKKIREQLAKKEASLEARFDHERESFAKKQEEISARISQLQNDAEARLMRVATKERELEEQAESFAEEKLRYDKENNIKLQTTSSGFVGGVVEDLKKKERLFGIISNIWSIGGGIGLASAVIFAAYIMYRTSVNLSDNISWSILTFLTVKSAIFATVAGIFSRYAFVLSKRYLNESLRVSDVIHDVSFGQLFVETYGATAGWEQVKEAFSHWHRTESPRDNIDDHIIDPANQAGLTAGDVLSMIEKIASIKNSPH